jgi:hypothetical protein
MTKQPKCLTWASSFRYLGDLAHHVVALLAPCLSGRSPRRHRDEEDVEEQERTHPRLRPCLLALSFLLCVPKGRYSPVLTLTFALFIHRLADVISVYLPPPDPQCFFISMNNLSLLRTKLNFVQGLNTCDRTDLRGKSLNQVSN